MSIQGNPFLLKCKSLLSRRGLECSIDSSLTLLKKGNVFTKPSCLAAHWRINCSKPFCFLKATTFSSFTVEKGNAFFLLSETGYSNNHPSCSTGNYPMGNNLVIHIFLLSPSMWCEINLSAFSC